MSSESLLLKTSPVIVEDSFIETEKEKEEVKEIDTSVLFNTENIEPITDKSTIQEVDTPFLDKQKENEAKIVEDNSSAIFGDGKQAEGYEVSTLEKLEYGWDKNQMVAGNIIRTGANLVEALFDSDKNFVEVTEENEAERVEEFEKELEFSEDHFDVLRLLDEEIRDHFSQNEVPMQARASDAEKLKSFLDQSICQHSTLSDLLMEQALDHFDTKEEFSCVKLIIGSLDERGFLTSSLEELSLLYEISIELLKGVLESIQDFDPPGVGVSSEQESLLIQLRRKGLFNTLSYKVVEHHFKDLLKNRIPLIAKKLKVSNQSVIESIEKDIIPLDLRPGVDTSTQSIHYIKPDVYVIEEEGKLKAVVNEDSLPSLRLSPTYLRMLNDKDVSEDTKEYIKQKVSSSKWLFRNLRQRNDTIVRIVESLIERQSDFFLKDGGQLIPMTMKVIADDLELHESTIARAVANKYINSPKGVFSLRSFFTHAYMDSSGENISSRTVKDILQEIVKEENKVKPYSDEIISKMIEKRGISCARRTVAKYRKELNIGNTSQRRFYG